MPVFCHTQHSVDTMETTYKPNQTKPQRLVTVSGKNRRLYKAALKVKWKAVKTFVSQNTKEYCENTTLHGLKYITSDDLYLIEKLFFAISFVTVVFGSVFFVAKIYDKWDTTPVIMSINSRPTYITKEPFPAVTICNLNQAYKSKAEQFSMYSTEHTMIQMLCKREVNTTIANTITDWNNLSNFIAEISQPCSNMLLTCRYGAVTYNCTDIFQPIVTDGGLCCTFNMVDPKFLYKHEQRHMNFTYPEGFSPIDWSTERSYPKNLPPSYIPFTAVGTGESLGLSFTLDVEADKYYCSSANSVGFKMLLHNPNEVPNMREIGLLLSPGRETKVRIFAQKTESEPSLRKIHRNARRCLFQDEKKLGIFKAYTQRNCEVECMASMLQTYCGCISYFMPMQFGNESICSIYEALCVERVRLQSMTNGYNGRSCPDFCWQSCFDLTYLPDFFTTPLTHFGFKIVNQVIENISSYYVERNIAVVNIYFKENSYRSNIQTELTGMTDFLSSVGGLIGLFFGFSFISVAEVVFYACLRPLRMAVVRQKRKFIEAGKMNMFHKLQPIVRFIKQKPSNQVFGSALQLKTKPANTSADLSLRDAHMGSELWRSVSEAVDNQSSKGSATQKIAWHPGMEYTP